MKTIIPITPHSGGLVDPKNIVGRDEFIELFWNILAYKGISLFAERRFGKSYVIWKMHHQPKKKFVTIYKSVQGNSDPEHFVDSLYEYAKEHKKLSDSIKGKFENTWNSITSRITTAAGIKFSPTHTIW